MILRSVMKHVRDQNWLAVLLDFLIVIIGAFIGIQVANCNEERAHREREYRLLAELRAETLQNAEAARSVGEGFLCADAASYITGSTLTPDGGFMLTL